MPMWDFKAPVLISIQLWYIWKALDEVSATWLEKFGILNKSCFGFDQTIPSSKPVWKPTEVTLFPETCLEGLTSHWKDV